jgi:hypothetical protein
MKKRALIIGITEQDEDSRIKHREAVQRWRIRNPIIPKSKPTCPGCLRNIHPEKWAYLAGIFDGEGSVSLTRVRNKNGFLKTYQLCVTVVCGTHLAAIEAIKEIVGQHGTIAGHGRKLEPMNGKGSRRQAWRFRIWGDHAAWFLKGVQPYLLMKTSQAELGILHQAGKRLGPCDDTRAAKEYTSKLALTILNQRGVQ